MTTAAAKHARMTAAQASANSRIAAAGSEMCPSGTRAAGRAAANWYRVVDAIARMGFVVRHGTYAEATAAGRDAAGVAQPVPCVRCGQAAHGKQAPSHAGSVCRDTVDCARAKDRARSAMRRARS